MSWIRILLFVFCNMRDMRVCLAGGKEQEGRDDSNIINYVYRKFVWDIIVCSLKVNDIRNDTVSIVVSSNPCHRRSRP